jgi:exonuclease SbcC
MLERLEIVNYQTHERRRLVLDPHVTTIVGASDAGKSAILRALRWVCTNRPIGTEHIRWGAEHCRVSLWVDGQLVRRVRGPNTNEYSLGPKTFKAFGNDVPPAIVNLLNVGPVNWQGQYDAPFWFSETPGEVSRNLNNIVNLGIIDDTLAYLANALRRATTAEEIAAERVATARATKRRWAFVPELERDLAKLEELHGDAYAARGRYNALVALRRAVAGHHATAARATKRAAAGRAVAALCRTAITARRHATALAALRARYAATRRVPRLPKGAWAPVQRLLNVAVDKRDDVIKIRKLIQRIRDAQQRVQTTKAILAKANKTLKEESQGVCPVCQGPLRL